MPAFTKNILQRYYLLCFKVSNEVPFTITKPESEKYTEKQLFSKKIHFSFLL